MALNQWLRAAADVLMPRTCSVCGTTLGADEPYVCRGCMAHLPRTRLEQVEFNTMEQLFAGKVPIERAAGFFYYEKDSPYASIIHDAKYRNMPKLGQWIAGQAYAEMTGLQSDPLHSPRHCSCCRHRCGRGGKGRSQPQHPDAQRRARTLAEHAWHVLPEGRSIHGPRREAGACR